MSVEFIFSPDNLIQARRNICAKNNQQPVNHQAPDREAEMLLRKLVNTEPDMYKATAFSLTDREAEIVAGYIPNNIFHLKTRTLMQILKYRLNERTCSALYYRWQEGYLDKDCNEFIKAITKGNRDFKKVLASNHIPDAVFLNILESRNIPLAFDEQLVGKRFISGDDFERKLRRCGVEENSLLDIDCKRALMTFCGRSEYLECSEENILYIVRGYDAFMLQKFLVNFLGSMDLWELQNYPNLAEYIRNITGHKKSASFAQFFEGVEPDMVNKYLNWINIYKINTYFEYDDRSEFWKQYRFENVIRYPVSNVVVMEFENYIAIEFLDVDDGTIYICDKHSFRQYFYLRLDSLSQSKLISYFRENQQFCILGKNHSEKWQHFVGNAIAKKHMGEKLPL